MRFQEKEWTCGPACVSNALKEFGLTVPERRIASVAGTISPADCAHCVELDHLLNAKHCANSHWKCKCAECRTIRSQWRRECDTGTDHDGIMRAIKEFGKPGKVTAMDFESMNPEDAWQWLHGSIYHGKVVILCIDRWSHWVVAFGSRNDVVNIFDPYPSKKNIKENGILPLTKEELMRRWYNGCKWVDKDNRLYAISVGRR